MIIGIPREIRVEEYRVGLSPAGVSALAGSGHAVLVEASAGAEAGFSDADYAAAGATILAAGAEIWKRADLLVKVKEPMESEYAFFRPGLILMTYLHLAADPHLTKALQLSGVTAIAYETIETPDRALPLLKPMSEIAGRLAVQIGAALLEKDRGGRGVLLGGVPGVKRGEVVILGGGVVGQNAAKIAVGMEACVTLLDIDIERLDYLDHTFQGRLQTLHSSPAVIAEALEKADLLIGAVLKTGARSPVLVSEDMVRSMKPGSVIVDVSVDHGGCVATSRPMLPSDPCYTVHGVLHFGVPNMPSAVARTASRALANASIDYVTRLADLGFERAIAEDHALFQGVNAYGGHITYEAVAEACGVEYKPLSVLL